MPEDLPDRMPDRMSEDMPEDMPDKVPEDMPEHMPEDMPGRMPEDMPDSMPEDIPDKLPEDMSDRMPEDFPVTKRIDVMVGITRSKVILVVWVRLLLCCLRHCLRNAYAATVGAYAAHPFEGVPTQAQRPHKATPQCMFLPTPSHFCLLLEGWKRNFCLRDHSPIHIFTARAPRLQSAHRHLAATPMCSSRTSNQVPKCTLNIWWINHDKSLKTQLVTFDYAGVKPSEVFDCR